LLSLRRGGGPDCFCWELRHRKTPMGVKVRVHGFRSPEAAEVAGKTALAEFLEGLSIEESLGAPNRKGGQENLREREQAGGKSKSVCLHLVNLCHEPSDHSDGILCHQVSSLNDLVANVTDVEVSAEWYQCVLGHAEKRPRSGTRKAKPNLTAVRQSEDQLASSLGRQGRMGYSRPRRSRE